MSPPSPAQLPTVSILIPVRNRRELLRTCLEGIRGLDYPPELIEVVVADAGSTDGSVETARAFGARVVGNPRGDECGGRNAAFAAASGEVAALCDSDSRPPRDWLRNAVAYLADPRVAGVGGPELTPQTGFLAQAIHCCFTIPSFLAVHSHSGREVSPREVPHVPTCNFVCRRSALARVMPLRWNTGPGTDLELGRRLRAGGYALLRVPDVRMWHHKRGSVPAYLTQLYHYGEGRAYVTRTGSPLGPAHGLAAAALPALLLAAVAGALEPAAIPWAGGLAAGCAGYALRLTRRVSVAAVTPPLLLAGTVWWSAGFVRVYAWPLPRDAIGLPGPVGS